MANKCWQILSDPEIDLSDNKIIDLYNKKQSFEEQFKALSNKFSDRSKSPSSFLKDYRSLLDKYRIHIIRGTGDENDCIQFLADTVNNERSVVANTAHQRSDPPLQLQQDISSLKQDSESVVINSAPDNPISSNKLHFISLYRMP